MSLDAMSNGDAIRDGIVPCETNPRDGSLSRTSDSFHACAVYTVGSMKGNKRHVCAGCYDTIKAKKSALV